MSKISIDDRKEFLNKRKVEHSGLDNPQSSMDGFHIRGVKRKIKVDMPHEPQPQKPRGDKLTPRLVPRVRQYISGP